ncbi:MAG TPA: type I phosphomannose isomerase catalytic subunit [Acidobacteriaceae bacterium]
MSSKIASPFRLAPFFSPRIWGTKDWSRWYDGKIFEEPVGESWLTGEDCVVETGPWAGGRFADVVKAHAAEILGDDAEAEFPLLLKLLAPKEKLSLQVHPDDAFAQQVGYPRGKTECWYVLDAEPEAAVALGFTEGTGPKEIREAVDNHTLEERMRWLPVTPGDMIFVDAGTVHAIGGGLTILETQQTSDITYRLYDYGRPRELHVDDALRVMKPKTRAGKVAPVQVEGFTRLIQEKYFTVDRFELTAGHTHTFGAMRVPQILVVLSGSATLTCDGESLPLERGKATVIPAGATAAVVQSDPGCTLIRAFPGK